MKKESKLKTCPDIEFVSAYFDNELDSGSAEFAHIKNCPECQKQIQTYQKLADTLKAELSSAVPKDIAKKILNGIEQRKLLEKQPSFNYMAMMKIAAMFIIIGLVWILALPENTPENNTDKTVDPIPEFLNLQADGNNNLSTLEFPDHKQIAGKNGTIDWDHFFPTSTNQNNEINFVDESKEDQPAEIPPVVIQVWVVKDLNNSLKKFAEFTKNDNLQINKDRNENKEVNLKISKLDLVELVRKCHKAGFKLLSPTQPQPEQNIFTGNKNDIVDYQATFTVK